MDARTYGAQLAAYQNAMASHWQTHGATAVHSQISALSHEQLVALAMANIGAQAAAVRSI
jgi:hypothetical protein